MEVPLKTILTAFSETASLNEFASDPKFCKNYFELSLNVFLWTNCLISHRIDIHLYILRKWQQACLNAIELVVVSVELAVGFTKSFSSCSSTVPVWIQWKTECDNVFLKARSLMILFLFLFFFSCQRFAVFLLYISATKDVVATHLLALCLRWTALLRRCSSGVRSWFW